MSQALPPGSRLPAVAQLAQMAMNPYGFFEQNRDRYGDLFTVRLPGQAPAVAVCEPEAVRTVLTAGYEDLTRFAEGVRFLVGDHSLIFLQDAAHRESRRLMLPPFHGERMRAYGGDMAHSADEMIAKMRDGDRRSLQKDLQDVTLRVILRCVFGITEERRLGELGRLIVEYLDTMMTPWAYGATLVLTGHRVREFLRARGKRMQHGHRKPSRWPIQSLADRLGGIDAILLDEIARCRGLRDTERAQRNDILSMLVAARFEDGSPMPDEVLRDHLMTLLVGGHETTATTMCWALECALRHPGTFSRMRAEVDSVMGDGFDPSRVKQLSYIGAVISESMRLYPIAPMISRQLKVETRLVGHTLPAGTVVAPCVYLIQRDARIWEQPTEFRPERFLSGKASVYEFFPFGAGVWKCLGAQFADYEMRVVLARLVAELDLELASRGGTRAMQRGFTVAPADGMQVRVRRRVKQWAGARSA